MMKLTVAFLATLAAADAAQSHGRRHVRRQYGEIPPYSLPGTGFPSSTATPAVASSSSAAVESSSSPAAAESSSSGLPFFPGTGTAPAIPTSSGTAPAIIPSSSAAEAVESSAYGTGFPTTAGPAVPTGGYGTGINGTDMITSTVYSTQTFTVTACPSTVSDCPAASTQTITSKVPVGVSLIPKPTPGPSSEYPAEETEVIESSVSEITHIVTETLTYTVGTGENAHPTTTELTSTSTETVYKTMTITKDHASPTGAYGEDEITGTTTLLTTSTTTKYITVHPTPSNTPTENTPTEDTPTENTPTENETPSDNEGGAAVPYPTTPAEGNSEECAPLPPVTLTVTAQETVTVTVGQQAPSSSAAEVTEAPSSSAAVVSEVKPTSVITVSVVPYPIGNGTVPQPTGVASTGFLTYTKPYGTGEVPVPSSTGLPADSLLPSFTLPAQGEDVASSSAYPTQETSSVAAPTAAPSGSYGSGYRKRFGLF